MIVINPLGNTTSRKDIQPGMRVKIEEKQSQGTGKLTEGIVKEILTNSSEHPYGIKVRLQGGQEGRVKEILSPILEKVTSSSISIDNKIKAGEGSSTEFKASFRFDHKRFKATGSKAQSEAVEKEISIAVVSLANASGGSVLIGVDNDGNIIGLSDDLSILKNPTMEYFQRELWQSLKDYIKDNAFVSTLKMDFVKINDKDVCEIDVPTAFEPVYVNDSDQECFVRMGNRSEKLEPSEFFKYCKTRFMK